MLMPGTMPTPGRTEDDRDSGRDEECVTVERVDVSRRVEYGADVDFLPTGSVKEWCFGCRASTFASEAVGWASSRRRSQKRILELPLPNARIGW